MISTLTKHETSTLIDGPVGKLEVIMAEPTNTPRNIWGIVCHPHPLYGGTMHNKVVTTLAKTFQGLGLTTVRFNFRGVGRSEGAFAEGEGELDDLVAVSDWILQNNPQHDIWLAGFSFGACIVARATTLLSVKKLVTVAPPVENVPFMQTLPPITVPWILVQGEEDDVVSPKAVFEWAKSRDPKPTIIRFPEAGHFFHGQLSELRLRLEDALR